MYKRQDKGNQSQNPPAGGAAVGPTRARTTLKPSCPIKASVRHGNCFENCVVRHTANMPPLDIIGYERTRLQGTYTLAVTAVNPPMPTGVSETENIILPKQKILSSRCVCLQARSNLVTAYATRQGNVPTENWHEKHPNRTIDDMMNKATYVNTSCAMYTPDNGNPPA